MQRRLLPPASVGSRPYDLLSVRQLHSGLFEPIDRLGSSGSSGISSGSSSNSSQGAELAAAGEAPKEHNQQGELLALQGHQGGGSRDMPNLDFCVATSTTGDGRMSPNEAVQDESTSTSRFFS